MLTGCDEIIKPIYWTLPLQRSSEGSANFSQKGHVENSLGSASHTVSLATTQLCCCSPRAARVNALMNEHGCVTKTLLKQSVCRIRLTGCSLPALHLDERAVSKLELMDQIWPASCFCSSWAKDGFYIWRKKNGWKTQKKAIYDMWDLYEIQVSVSVNKVLLVRTHLFTFELWLLPCMLQWHRFFFF